ncbi:hypothetical protein ANAPH1_00917 [Anaplasma phagocytophilum]|nr:hypothetical protein ANAPH1_00917 [Anaplasma phagocytophilum]
MFEDVLEKAYALLLLAPLSSYIEDVLGVTFKLLRVVSCNPKLVAVSYICSPC